MNGWMIVLWGLAIIGGLSVLGSVLMVLGAFVAGSRAEEADLFGDEPDPDDTDNYLRWLDERWTRD